MTKNADDEAGTGPSGESGLAELVPRRVVTEGRNVGGRMSLVGWAGPRGEVRDGGFVDVIRPGSILGGGPVPPSSLVIRQVYQIAAPPKAVFRALTESKELVRWFLAKATLEKVRGGKYAFTWHGGYRHTGTVLAFEPDRRLTLTWPSGKLPDTRATFTLRRSGRGTRVEIRHSGYGTSTAWLELYGGTQSGWAYFFMNLKSVLEHGVDLRSARDAP
jgi:uncharacterized protein YndB with AHSA1/START domain